MPHAPRLRFLALMGMAVFALAACRAPAQTGVGNTSSPGSEPAGTSTSVPIERSTSTGGIPAPGTVTLVLSKSSYASGDTIEVTIRNGPKTGIVASDHQSDCTLVQLERLNSGTWQSERPCQLDTPTSMVSLAPGSDTLQVLAPEYGWTAACPGGICLNTAGPWPAGTYRIAFGYQAGSEVRSAHQELVYSATFAVR